MLEDVTTRGEGVRGATELEEGRLARRAVLRKRQAERRLLHRGHRAGEVHRDGAATPRRRQGRGPIAARKRRAKKIEARRRTATRGHTIAPRVAEPISREGDAATWSVRASGARASSDNLHEGTPSPRSSGAASLPDARFAPFHESAYEM